MRARHDDITAVCSFRSVANKIYYAPQGRVVFDGQENFIENLCCVTRDLPSMRAVMQQASELADIKIYASDLKGNSLGLYSKKGIEISMDFGMGESSEDRYNIQLATLPHELRHGYQSVMCCSRVCGDTRIAGNLESLIMIDRHLEADATVFSLAAMYELYLEGDTRPWSWAGEIHTTSVEAYESAVRRDMQSHWNGEAAQAAFEAYFSSDNKEYLKKYDLRVCQDFKRNSCKLQQYEPVSAAARKYIVYESLQPISRMPYLDEEGDLVERQNYRPLICGNVMNALSHYVRDCLNEAKKSSFPKPQPRP